MKAVRYSRYEGPEDDLDLSELVGHLQDLLMESGFSNPWDPDPEAGQALEDLLAAIAAALERAGMVPRDMLEEAWGADDWLDTRLGKLAMRLAERLQEEGFLRMEGGGGQGPPGEARFELTDKAVDLLGHRSLRDILGMGQGLSTGSHRTLRSSAGIETAAGSRPFEFGENLHLDATETLRSAAMRFSGDGRLDIEESDLYVLEGEHQAAAATVLMLDCSHSMILYGEDRFTPAKKVALALAHLIRTQYRGDSLSVVLFHDSAEEVRLGRLATTQVGPYHTNTAEGLRLARRILSRQQRDMRQIIMITDGKPTAVTLGGGRIYKNAYGRDPLVLGETLRQVAECRRHGIQINTFMLARDPDLLAFVQRVAAMTRGKAYLTSAADVGTYVLHDFRINKQKRVG